MGALFYHQNTPGQVALPRGAPHAEERGWLLFLIAFFLFQRIGH